MKRNIYLILALLFMGTLQMRAQQMIVQTTDGEEAKFEEADYASCRLTFSGGQMHFHVGDVVKSSFDVKTIQRISFYGLQSNAKITYVATGASYSSVDNTLVVNALPGTVVTVYHANGARALTYMQTIASTDVDVSHFPAGLYVVVVGDETFKFVKL